MKVLPFKIPTLTDALRGLRADESLNDHGPEDERELDREPAPDTQTEEFKTYLTDPRDPRD